MEDLINLISSGGREWGWVAVVLAWMAPRIWSFWQKSTQRSWNRDDRREVREDQRTDRDLVDDRTRQIKIDELYERLLKAQNQTLEIIMQNTVALNDNSKALGELRKAFQQELPQVTNLVRDLTMRVSRLENPVEAQDQG